MKHLKLFESFMDIDSIEKITSNKYGEELHNRKGDHFEKREIELIKSIDNIKLFEEVPGSGSIIMEVKLDNINGYDTLVVYLNKMQDEWYLLHMYKLAPDYGVLTSLDRNSEDNNNYFMCDQFDGLQDMVDHIKKVIDIENTPIPKKTIGGYIKSLFESYLSDSIKELSSDEYLSEIENREPENFSKRDIDIIKTIDDIKNVYHTKGVSVKNKIEFTKDESSMSIEVSGSKNKEFDKLHIYIDKKQDEWYLLQIYKLVEGDENEGDDPTGYSYFMCDQIDGLQDMIDMIKRILGQNDKPVKKGVMNYLKSIGSKIFEGRKEEYLDICWKSASLGDIKSESDIYCYIQELHTREHDFYDGDLGDRIEEYSRYKLKEISISKIDIDEWELDEEDVEFYEEMYKNSSDYPPIVLSSPYMGRYTIIDGTHRANAVNNSGLKTIKAWVGLES